MNNQLGPGFTNFFLIPRMKDIFSPKNIESDERLQILLSFKGVLNPDQIKGLKQQYFSDWTGTVMDDQENKNIFWDMLIAYIGYVKQVSNNNKEVLATMFLPGEKGLSKEAANRYAFFCFLFNKTLEKKFIEEEIAKQKILDEQKNKLRDLNKKGELVMARKKGEGNSFGIVTKDQIEKAQQSELARDELMGELYTKQGEEGGRQVVLMNPPQSEGAKAKPGVEIGSSLTGMIKSVWENIFKEVSENFKEAKLEIQGDITIDSTGVVKFYITKGRTRMLVEFSAPKPVGPEGRRYKFTFVDRPAQNFSATDNEIKKYFVQQDLNLEQVHQIQVGKEPKTAGVAPPTGAPLPPEGRPAPGQPIERGAAGYAGGAPSRPIMPKTEGMPAIPAPDMLAKAKQAAEGKDEGVKRAQMAKSKGLGAARKGGVMAAKRGYQEGRKGAPEAEVQESETGETTPRQPQTAAEKRRQRRKQVNPLKRVALITGAAGAAAVGGSFFTLFFT